MDFLPESPSIQYLGINYRISCNKLKGEQKLCLDLTSITNPCHGIQKMDSLVKTQSERLLLMMQLNTQNKCQDRTFITMRRNKRLYLENQSRFLVIFKSLFYSRAEGFDFMSEVQYLGHLNPSATSYNPDVLLIVL